MRFAYIFTGRSFSPISFTMMFVGSENTTVPPGSGVTHSGPVSGAGASNAVTESTEYRASAGASASNAVSESTEYRVTNEKTTVFNVGSENCEPTAPGRDASVTPGLGVTHHATYGVTNAGANASAGSNSETGSKGYRANGGETSISNTAHSVEKYPEN